MGKPRQTFVCSIEGCGREHRAQGFCQKHYAHNRKFGYAEKRRTGERTAHPLYLAWWERKKSGVLCPEWTDDLWAFTAAVGERPSKGHFLVPIDGKRPYGPDNFKWLEKLKRQPGETKKAFWARKWANRQAEHPGLEYKRRLRRAFGITPEDYAAMMALQDGVCAICHQSETSVDPKTMAPKRLAVDHRHDTKKVRGLLCFRCNSTIGKVNDDPQLLTRMVEYLTRHAA